MFTLKLLDLGDKEERFSLMKDARYIYLFDAKKLCIYPIIASIYDYKIPSKSLLITKVGTDKLIYIVDVSY